VDHALRPQLVFEAQEIAKALTFRAVLTAPLSDALRQLPRALPCVELERFEKARWHRALLLEEALAELGNRQLEQSINRWHCAAPYPATPTTLNGLPIQEVHA
jgi:hypothetical protein